MKKILVAVLCTLFLAGCASEPKEERSFDTPNTEVKEVDNTVKAESATIAQKVLENQYKLANFKINMTDSDYKVYQMPDDKNADTGEVYMNLYSTMGTFEFQDKNYSFMMLHSMKDESSYAVVHFETNYDDSLTIEIPLESDK
ncbi:putative periplasmic lipoprotein [Vagococcus fluvialis]|uniref:hypothetical protein n=1 Tax=Vagococcus fluvialis TaxID=2738 RepID=UPI001D0AB145|nr:hypothetical protein [Vagococcus fluvialis]UDM78898.1 hypothetical protein K5K97_09245 [Vagococcus fluvialis]